MKKLSTLKTMLAAALLAVGVGNVWADEQPTPVFFNDFSSTDGLTVVGNGIFEDDADARFGKVFHNDPTLTKAKRTNYLQLPADVLSHSTETKEMTIGFWVNVKDAADYWYAPIFTAYGAAPANNANTWPMFVCQSRGLLQVNCAGWCDFTAAQNDKVANIEGTQWLDDKAWHYYTATLTATKAVVYVDGEVLNSWTVSGEGNGNVIAGLFSNGADLKYICLGGNQAWDWNDLDPAYAFDDFAVYDKALTAEQIKAVMDKKLAYTFDFANNPQNWPVTTVVYGDEFDAAAVTTLTVNNVVLTSIQNATYANVIYKNGDAAPAFRVFRGNDFKLSAPEGKAIVKVEVTMAADTFDFTADNGAIADGVWTGNAAEVTFNTTAIRLIAKIAVTLADENDETIKPAKVDVEVADIAAFNAVEDGKIVKLALSHAKVNGYCDLWANNYIEDASGAVIVKGITLTAGTELNGFIIGKKSSEETTNAIEYFLTATDATTFEVTATNLSGKKTAVSDIAVQANYGKLITVENVTITGSGQKKTLTDAEGKTIAARDYMGILPAGYEWPEKVSSFTGIIVDYYGWILLPISADAIVAAGTQKVAEFDFLNNNMDLVIGSTSDANGGNLGGKSVKKDDVTISFVNSSTMPTRYYFNAGKNQLQVISGGQIRFSAAEGQAITKIEITPVAATNNKWNVDGEVGTLSEDKLTWAGNTTTVRFTATGALYLTNIVVTTAAKNDATITPADNETYTEVSSLAEFNALEKGTLAKLNLTNAVITSGMVNDWGYYVQDATAGAHFYCTGLNFEVNDAINGFVYVKKDFNQPGPRIAMTEKTNADNLEVTHNATYSPIEGTLAEAVVAANNNRVIKLTGVAVKGTAETEATITSGESSLPISNGKTNYAPYVYKENLSEVDYSSATVVGILWSNAAANTFKLYPLSITEDNGSGIETIHNSQFTVKNSIYNLQGIRLSGLQKGLNIVNGKKVVIK